MPKTKKQKEEEVQGLVQKIKDSKISLFTTQTGIDVKTIQELRSSLKKQNIDFLSCKKTLLNRALQELGISNLDLTPFQGIVGTVVSYDDETTCPNLLYKFSKKNENFQIQAGVLDGEGIQQEIVINLAKLPSKDELRAKFVRVINGPIYGFVSVVAGPMRGFVQALNQIREQKV